MMMIMMMMLMMIMIMIMMIMLIIMIMMMIMIFLRERADELCGGCDEGPGETRRGPGGVPAQVMLASDWSILLILSSDWPILFIQIDQDRPGDQRGGGGAGGQH